jgi:hypothetical protein
VGERRRRGVRIDPSDLALEVVSIVIAILLATLVAQILQARTTAARTHEALVQIRQEIAHDDVDLRARMPLHRGVWISFRRLVAANARDERLSFDRFESGFFDAAPHGLQPFDGTTVAWDLARASNAVADVPYALRARLEERYAAVGSVAEIDRFVLSTFDAAPTADRPNFFFAASALTVTLADLVFAEQRLAKRDRDALAALAEAGIR